MHLDNFNKVRIKQYDKGYCVEMLIGNKFVLFGENKEVWKHIISYSGLKDHPFYFSTYEGALEEAVKLFRWDLIYYSKYQ